MSERVAKYTCWRCLPITSQGIPCNRIVTVLFNFIAYCIISSSLHSWYFHWVIILPYECSVTGTCYHLCNVFLFMVLQPRKFKETEECRTIRIHRGCYFFVIERKYLTEIKHRTRRVFVASVEESSVILEIGLRNNLCNRLTEISSVFYVDE